MITTSAAGKVKIKYQTLYIFKVKPKFVYRVDMDVRQREGGMHMPNISLTVFLEGGIDRMREDFVLIFWYRTKILIFRFK